VLAKMNMEMRCAAGVTCGNWIPANPKMMLKCRHMRTEKKEKRALERSALRLERAVWPKGAVH
jgi:hypothetical protein